MGKIRIAYICWLSNQKVRSHLKLRDYTLRNIVLRLFHKPESSYSDYGIWNSDFVDEFSKMDEYEFHIISPHNGMIKNKIVEFEEDGINYHIYKCDSNLVTEAFHSYTHYNERTDYRCLRKKILNIVERISPQVIIVCGAEQPKFSPVIWDLHNTPTLVLLETAVNDPLLMKMMRGAGIYGFVERRSFAEMHYFCTGIKKYYSIVRQFNKDAECLLFSRFPSHVPPLEKCPVKEFDFLFYAAVISQNKGVEDVILAFNKVVDSYPTATLNICGKIDDAYREHLNSLIDNRAKNNISFTGYFETVDEKLSFVQKTKIVVLPSITSPLNGTVRESMLMKLPTIVYETTATPKINCTRHCLLCAKMQDVGDLSNKMIYAIENPQEMDIIANNGYMYALENYSNRSVAKQLINAAIAVLNKEQDGKAIPDEYHYEP